MGILKAQWIPNWISIFRLLLVIPIFMAIMDDHYVIAWILVVLAGVSDGIDGYLARRYSWGSFLGAILDPLADKLLINLCFIAFALKEVIPFWLMGVVIGRDLVIVLGSFTYYLVLGRHEISPLFISKLNTFFQIVFVALVLLNLTFSLFSNTIIQLLVYTVLTTSLLSGIEYVWVWGKRSRRELRHNSSVKNDGDNS